MCSFLFSFFSIHFQLSNQFHAPGCTTCLQHQLRKVLGTGLDREVETGIAALWSLSPNPSLQQGKFTCQETICVSQRQREGVQATRMFLSRKKKQLASITKPALYESSAGQRKNTHILDECAAHQDTILLGHAWHTEIFENRQIQREALLKVSK